MSVSRGTATRACPIPGCTEARRISALLCRTHWYRVPKALRDSVWHWWRRRNDVALSAEERLAAGKEWLKAAREAELAAAGSGA